MQGLSSGSTFAVVVPSESKATLEANLNRASPKSPMDEPQKQGRLDGKPLIEDDMVSVGKPGHEVEENAGNGKRGTQGHIKEWHLDDLLSFKPSLESTIDGSSSKAEGLEDEPASARLASRPQSAKMRFSSKTDFALIILNQAIDLEIEVFMNLFFHCILRLVSF